MDNRPIITTYRDVPIYCLETYTTPYYYFDGGTVYVPRMKRYGGRMAHSMRLRTIEREIDKWIAAQDAARKARS